MHPETETGADRAAGNTCGPVRKLFTAVRPRRVKPADDLFRRDLPLIKEDALPENHGVPKATFPGS